LVDAPASEEMPVNVQIEKESAVIANVRACAEPGLDHDTAAFFNWRRTFMTPTKDYAPQEMLNPGARC
jgi:hypothetical protein